MVTMRTGGSPVRYFFQGMALTLFALFAGLLVLIFLSAFPFYPPYESEDDARMRAMTLCEAAKAWELKYGDKALKELDDLAPYLDRGERGVYDPWGAKYQFKTVEDQNGRKQFVFWTTNPKTDKLVGWPKELAEPNR
jgi:hypothetical protein